MIKIKFLLCLLLVHLGLPFACAQKPSAAGISQTTDWTQVNATVAKGKVDALEVPDNQYGRKRKVWVYLPAGYEASAARAYPLIISFDGQDYINDIPAPTILDNLIAAKKIEPTVQVFVDNSEDRLGDLANHQKFADFVAKDLMPWIRKNYHVTTRADETIVCGYSAGGLGASYVAYRYPSLFGKVLSQSGAYWRGNEGSSGPEWLTSQYESSPKLGIKFYIVVGGAETMKNASGKSMLEINRHLRDVLVAKGYEVGYLEAPGGGHMPESWRTQLADGLMFLQSKH
jgi:enterochelin esterase family protein